MDHAEARKANIERMKDAYALKKYGSEAPGDGHSLPPSLRQVGCASPGEDSSKKRKAPQDDAAGTKSKKIY